MRPPSANFAGKPLRVCRIATVPLTFQSLLFDQLRAMAAAGIDLTLVSSASPQLEAIGLSIGARTVGISMRREPAPFSDLWSLFQLARFLRANHFDITHSSTPKAGFL